MSRVSPGRIFIISGPSQVGKDTVVRILRKNKKLKLKHIITHTSRPPRPGEKKGLTYHFHSEADFKLLIKQKLFLEWARVRQAYFGTPKMEILKVLTKGYNVILQIDVQGAAKIKNQLPETVLIFIKAESAREVRRRIFSSPTMTLSQKNNRWQEAQKELRAKNTYDYIITNRFGYLTKTITQITRIISKYAN